jgi:hypothetical protein
VDAGPEVAPVVETQQEAAVAAPIPETISEATPSALARIYPPLLSRNDPGILN